MSIGMRIAILVTICAVLPACSSNMTRFDYPVFGMNEDPAGEKQLSSRRSQDKHYSTYNQKFKEDRGTQYNDGADYKRLAENRYDRSREVYDTASTDKDRLSQRDRYVDDARVDYDRRQVEREQLPELRQQSRRETEYKTAYKPEQKETRYQVTTKARRDAEGRHIVSEGDTLYNISRRYGITMAKIRDENELENNDIKLGQRLVIPGFSKVQSKEKISTTRKQSGQKHRVVPGDTLYNISRRHGVSTSELAEANDITDNNVKLGQELIIPGDEKRRSPVRVASIERKLPVKKSMVEQRRKVSVRKIPKHVNAKKIKLDKKIVKTRKAGRNRFMWPVGGKILSKFGRQKSGTMNDGVNLAVPRGTKVKAAEAGVVAYAGNELKGYGNLVLVRHKDNWVTAYAHNDKLLVKRGDKVRRGQIIAKSGKTGSVYEPQLHFELRKGSKPVNPSKYLAMR